MVNYRSHSIIWVAWQISAIKTTPRSLAIDDHDDDHDERHADAKCAGAVTAEHIGDAI
jgi:hypothetical protein